MPYQNFHAVRIIEPSKFKEGSMRTKSIAEGVSIIVGKLKGQESMTTQAYRFEKNKFTPKQVKSWIKEKKVEYIKFEPAKEDSFDDSELQQDVNDEHHNVYRFDVFDNIKFRLSEPFKETSEGYLRGRAIVTNTGIFKYITKDGELCELRPDEEVFNQDSLNSLKMIPITNEHPKEMVTKDNINRLQVGMTGEEVMYDGHAVSVPLIITDPATIKDIQEEGKTALSCGYHADLEYKSGYAFGNNKYDAIQRNIAYNHIAVVDHGRAGDLARMNFRVDSIDSAYRIDDTGVTSDKDNNEGDINMKKIMLDGVEYQAEADVIKAYNKLKEDNETLNKDKVDLSEKLSKAEADRDTFKDELEDSKKKLEETTTQVSDSEIQEAVKERLTIIKVADSLEVQYKTDGGELSNSDIKKAIIVKQYPNAKLDNADDIYITARYDAVVEKLEETQSKQKDADNKKKVFADNIPNNNGTVNNENQKPLSRSDRYKQFCNDLEDRCEKYNGAISVN